MAFVLRIVNKGIATGIGLAGEKYHDHKDRKAALALQEQIEQDSELGTDEREWALDEAQGEPPSYEDSEAQEHQKEKRPAAERTISDLVHDSVPARATELQKQPTEGRKLPFPVVIPQRRPGAKDRGFARAYAPDLDDFGIDEVTWLRFLKNFQESSKASPWLNALFITAGAVGFFPGAITMAVSISVQFAAGTAIELQSRYRANAFLDEMNREYFMPKGLYAMVLIMKDDVPSNTEGPTIGYETVNLETAKHISKWGLPQQSPDDEQDLSKGKKILRPIRLASGKTDSNSAPMEVAPLVYPGLEDMMERPDVVRDESFKDKLQRNKKFVASYFDKRAQALYEGNNPDSVLTSASSGNTPQFRNRFADPNHPCNNGHLFSLVTGGKYVAQPRGRRSKLREVGEDGKLKPAVKREHKIRGPISLVTHGVRKVLTPNIMYLTVVNLPNDEELAAAKAMLEGPDGKGLKEMLQDFRVQQAQVQASGGRQEFAQARQAGRMQEDGVIRG